MSKKSFVMSVMVVSVVLSVAGSAMAKSRAEILEEIRAKRGEAVTETREFSAEKPMTATGDKDVNGHQDVEVEAKAEAKASATKGNSYEDFKKALGMDDASKAAKAAERNSFQKPSDVKKLFRNVTRHPANKQGKGTNGQICNGPKVASFKVPVNIGILVINTECGDYYPGDTATLTNANTIWWVEGLVEGTHVWDPEKGYAVSLEKEELPQLNLPVYKDPVQKIVDGSTASWKAIASGWKPAAKEKNVAWSGKAIEPCYFRVPAGWEVNFMLEGNTLTAQAGQDVLLKDGALNFTARNLGKKAWNPTK